jgi:hypothetical protein
MAIRRIRRQGCEGNCREAKQKRQAKAAQKTHATDATSIPSATAHWASSRCDSMAAQGRDLIK